eukprot:1158961-Pelagomonas_calceolata.AAC.5
MLVMITSGRPDLAAVCPFRTSQGTIVHHLPQPLIRPVFLHLATSSVSILPPRLLSLTCNRPDLAAVGLPRAGCPPSQPAIPRPAAAVGGRLTSPW